MPGRDKHGNGGRSEEDRLRDLAARERAREEGKRPPPSFGPSTRAGRERAAANGRALPTPAAAARARQDANLDFDFARPSTRAAAPRPETLTDLRSSRETVTATVEAPPAAAPEPAPAPDPAPATAPTPRTGPQGPPVGDGPQFAPRAPNRRSAERAERSSRSSRSTRSSGRDRTTSRSPKPTRAAATAGGGRSTVDALLDQLRRHRVAVAGAAAGVVLLFAVFSIAGGGDDTAGSGQSEAAKKKAPSPYGKPTPTPLPPETRVIAYTGAPQAKELGILGTMPFERAANRLERQSAPYDRSSRPVLPAFDLIATIANAHPGPADKYRTRQSGKVIARYLRAARRHNAALILDVQPGTSNFVDEIKPLEKWLKEPDVHLALDPEWRMRPGVAPGSEIGWVSAGEVTATLNRVARIVRANDLPPKLVIVHRFTDGMIKDLPTVDVPKEVVGVISIDGVGTRTQKIATYDRIAPTLPKPWLPGFKLFYVEDKAAGGMLSGKQVMALKPRPHVVLYE